MAVNRKQQSAPQEGPTPSVNGAKGVVDVSAMVDDYIDAKKAYDNLMETSKTVARYNACKEQVLGFVESNYADGDTAELRGAGDESLSVTARPQVRALSDDSEIRRGFVAKIGGSQFIESATFPTAAAKKLLPEAEFEHFFPVKSDKARSIKVKKDKKK